MPSPDNRLDEEAITVPELVNHALITVLNSRDSALANAVKQAVLDAAGSIENFAAHSSSPRRPDPAK